MLKRWSVLSLVLALIAAARVFFRSRTDIAVEVLALRQQVAVLKRKRPKPPLCPIDRLFWTVLRATWSRWKDALVIVKPETVVGSHRLASAYIGAASLDRRLATCFIVARGFSRSGRPRRSLMSAGRRPATALRYGPRAPACRCRNAAAH